MMIGVRCTFEKSNKNDVNILVNPIKRYLLCAIAVFAIQIFYVNMICCIKPKITIIKFACLRISL